MSLTFPFSKVFLIFTEKNVISFDYTIKIKDIHSAEPFNF